MDSPAPTSNEFRPEDAQLDLNWSALASMMAILGQAQHVGCCFAFKRADYPPETWPTPDYEHRIYSDGVTDYYIAVRPDADGKYDEKALEGMKLLR